MNISYTDKIKYVKKFNLKNTNAKTRNALARNEI